MNRPLRILLFVLAGLVGVTLIAVLALKLILNEERLRSFVEPPLEEALARNVTIGGMRIGVFRSFPRVSLGMDDVVVHTPPGPDGDRPDLASFDRLWVDVALGPLLNNRLVIAGVELDSARVFVEYYADGTSNLDVTLEQGDADPEAPPEAGESEADSAASPSVVQEIDIERVQITNGQLAYMDADGSVYAIQDLDVLLSARLADVYEVDVSSEASGVLVQLAGVPYLTDAEMGLDLAASVDMNSEHLIVNRAALAVEELALNLSGTVDRWSRDTMVVDLQLDAPEGQVRGLWTLLPGMFKEGFEDLQADGTLALTATVQGPYSATQQPALDARLELTDGRIQYPGVPVPIEGLTVRAALTNERFDLERFEARAAGNTVSARATVSNFDAPNVDADLTTALDLGSVKQFYPLGDSMRLGGAVNVDARVSGPVSTPDAVEGTGTIRLDGVAFAGPALEQPLDSLTGSMTLDRDRLDIPSLRMNLGRSDLTVEGTLTHYLGFMADSTTGGPVPELTGRLSSRYFNVSDQLSEDTTATEPVEPPNMRIDVSMAMDAVEYEGVTLEDARGRLRLEQGVFYFEEAEADLFGGLLTAGGRFDLSNPLRPYVAAAVRLNGVPATDFFQSIPLADRFARLGSHLEAIFTSGISFEMALDETYAPILSTTTAEGLFQVDRGTLSDLPIQGAVARFTGIEPINELTIEDWRQTFAVSGGRLLVQDLEINAGSFAMGLTGSQGVEGDIDYTMSLSLPESMSASLQNAPVNGALGPIVSAVEASLVDPETGRITLDLKAGGTFSEPQLSLDRDMATNRLRSQANALLASARDEAQARLDSLEAAARARLDTEADTRRKQAEEAAGALLDEQKDRLTDEAGDLVGETLDSTLTDVPVDSLVEEGKEELEDRLKGLFGRKKKKNDNQ